MFLKFLLATTFVAGLVTPVFADTTDWSGVYFGINGGLGSGDAKYTLQSDTGAGFGGAPFHGTGHQTPSGFLGGGQAGYDFECPGHWVFGALADFDAANVKSDLSSLAGFGGFMIGFYEPNLSSKLLYLGTARARAGYTGLDNSLLYVTGGLAYGRVESSFYITLPPPTPFGPVYTEPPPKSSERTGWTAGAGAEIPISNGLRFSAEYLYADLGEYGFVDTTLPLASGGFGGPGSTHVTASVKTTANILRIGLSYALN